MAIVFTYMYNQGFKIDFICDKVSITYISAQNRRPSAWPAWPIFWRQWDRSWALSGILLCTLSANLLVSSYELLTLFQASLATWASIDNRKADMFTIGTKIEPQQSYIRQVWKLGSSHWNVSDSGHIDVIFKLLGCDVKMTEIQNWWNSNHSFGSTSRCSVPRQEEELYCETNRSKLMHYLSPARFIFETTFPTKLRYCLTDVLNLFFLEVMSMSMYLEIKSI